MATPEEKYNQPLNYYHTVDCWFNSVWTDLKLHMDSIYFIYAGFNNQYDIRTRSNENILEQIAEARSFGKRNIIFDCMSEGISSTYIKRVHNIVENAKLVFPDLSYFYMSGAMDGDRVYSEICKKNDMQPNMKVFCCNFFECLSKDYPIYRNEYVVENKPKIYSCLNRVMRPHRIALLDKLLGENLVNDCYYSFYDSMIDDGGLSNIDLNVHTNIRDNIDLVKTLRLNFDPSRKNPTDIQLSDMHLYDETYFSVITETGCYELIEYPHCVFFSEKIFKPMATLHPFILVAMPGSIAKLRELGYKTFHPYIDESYDLIKNDDERLNAIVNEIQRLKNKNPSEWLEWCENIKPIVEHNQQHLYRNTGYIVNKDLISQL